jgi:hypothetical protein
MFVDFVKLANEINETKFLRKVLKLDHQLKLQLNQKRLNSGGLNPRSLLPFKSKRHALGR